jgi:uncharacterized membrane protein YjjB (DUF3815 family)
MASGIDYQVTYVKFVWVPVYAVSIACIYQAKTRQMPIMALIAFASHQSTFWVSSLIPNNLQIVNAVGAFVTGCMANLYGRFFHGLAAAAMVPSVFVAVPGTLAASGGLVAGITSADQITGHTTGISVINNGTAGFLTGQKGNLSESLYSGTIFNVAYSMIQIAIGMSVGLYLSALVVYPWRKKRSGLL